ncbi:MAG: hypothetical protein ACLRSY_07185, partial [Acutalibacter sp.]
LPQRRAEITPSSIYVYVSAYRTKAVAGRQRPWFFVGEHSPLSQRHTAKHSAMCLFSCLKAALAGKMKYQFFAQKQII